MSGYAAWLLQADGTVEPLAAVRLSVWPGTAMVTHLDGTVTAEPRLNVLAGDNLDRRWEVRMDGSSWT